MTENCEVEILSIGHRFETASFTWKQQQIKLCWFNGFSRNFLFPQTNHIRYISCTERFGKAVAPSTPIREEFSVRISVKTPALLKPGYGMNSPGSFPVTGKIIPLYFTASRPALGLTQPPIQQVPGTLSSGVKWVGREADHSPPSSAEFKNGGAIPPLPIRLHGVVMN
jgi:hypothetical protein